MANPNRGQVLHRNDSEIARVKVKVILQILAHQDRTSARERDLIGGIVAAPVPFNDNRALDGRIVVLCQGGIQ
jgi:hypothetical protein